MRLEGVVGISGTPGVGKSSVARALAAKLGAKYVDLSEAVIENRLYIEYDAERSSYVIDEDRVRSFIESLWRSHKLVVVDSHYAELIPHDILIAIYVLRLNPRLLIDRLLARGWSARKVAENVEAELLSVCTRNAVEEHGADKVFEIDVTGKSVDEVVETVYRHLLGEASIASGPRIDWLSQLSEEDLLYVMNFIETHLP